VLGGEQVADVGGVSKDEGEDLEARRAVTPRSVRALSEMPDE